MRIKGRKKIICIAIVLGTSFLGTSMKVEAQILKDYETDLTDIIRCNDRSGFDTGIVAAAAAVIRIRFLFLIVLMLMGVVISNNGMILKLAMFLLIGVAGVGISYEKLVTPHIESAKNFSATMRSQASSVSSVNGVVVAGNNSGTNIANPPSNNDGYVVLPPPPPLDGTSENGAPGYNSVNSNYPAC